MAKNTEFTPMEMLIFLIIVGAVLIWIYVVPPVVKWFQDNASLIITGIVSVVAITVLGIVGWTVWNAKMDTELAERRKIENERMAEEKARYEAKQKAEGLIKYESLMSGSDKWGTPEQIEQWKNEDREYKIQIEEEEMGIRKIKEIVEYIENFEPSRNYKNEFGYHIELQGYLKGRYDQSMIEIQTGSSRPDIVIDSIAIEVKGPTHSKDLVTIPDKILRYSKYYDHIIVVLFNVSVNERRYDEWLDGITTHYDGLVTVICI